MSDVNLNGLTRIYTSEEEDIEGLVDEGGGGEAVVRYIGPVGYLKLNRVGIIAPTNA